MIKSVFSKPGRLPGLKLGVSACLLGLAVRWDGRHKLDLYVRDVLGKNFGLVGLCPEKQCGLGVPREPIRLEGDPGSPRLVALKTRTDLTERMQDWIRESLEELERENLCGFVFKAKSPSCGLKSARVFGKSRIHTSCRGLFAAAFIAKFPRIPVIEEQDLFNPLQKAVFLESISRLAKSGHGAPP